MENIVELFDTDTIKDEASLWVVKLQGFTYKTGQPVPAEQVQALRQWLAKSDQHRDCFVRMLAAWDGMAMLEELADILPLTEVTEPVEPAPQAVAWPQWLLAKMPLKPALALPVMASCAVVLSLVVALLPPRQLYTTAVGEQASFTLADGTVLTLNTQSELKINYSDKQRSVTLRRGEAHFEVAKNPDRPFVVRAGQGAVWAVGTAFNVSHRDDYVDVLVAEGKVKVFSGLSSGDALPQLVEAEPAAVATQAASPDYSAAPSVSRDVFLVAGEAAQYQDHIVSKQALEKTYIDKKLAWQKGVLIFDGETLEVAMAEIARYSDRPLVISDHSIRKLRVGGRFKTDNIPALLETLSKSLNIDMKNGEGSQLVFSAKPLSSKKIKK